MTRDDAQTYAGEWVAAWNRRDVEAVLAHFSDDVVFTSPRALATVGTATVRGKAALRDYWNAALSRAPKLAFTLRRIVWDAATTELAIVYDRDVDGHQDAAIEVLHFGADGRVIRGEVFYGVRR